MAPGALHVSADVVAAYQNAFKTYGRDEQSLFWTKSKQPMRFAALCRHIEDAPAHILDFGCGLGDFALWLRDHRPSVSYKGVDVVGDFIDSNIQCLPQFKFERIGSTHDINETYDDIVCSGVFNLVPDNDAVRHWQHIQATLHALFQKSRRALHVDFLAHDADYRQNGSYHQNIYWLVEFVERRLSKRYCIDRSYMPYEYCISIFADREILRPRNVYRSP